MGKFEKEMFPTWRGWGEDRVVKIFVFGFGPRIGCVADRPKKWCDRIAIESLYRRFTVDLAFLRN